MSEVKFTPGPWRWKGEDYRGGWGWQVLVGPDGEGLICGEDSDGPYKHLKAFVPIEPRYCETAPGVHVLEADAHLIAAAPDLYSALKMVLDDPYVLDGRPRTYRYVQDALAKARGEE